MKKKKSLANLWMRPSDDSHRLTALILQHCTSNGHCGCWQGLNSFFPELGSFVAFCSEEEAECVA